MRTLGRRNLIAITAGERVISQLHPSPRMPRILITLTVLFLTLSAVFGVLNTRNARNLREIAARNESARASAEQERNAKAKELRAREAEGAANFTDTEAKMASAEADLIKSQSERAELHAQLQASKEKIAEMQRRLEETPSKELMPDALPMPGTGELQAQLEDTRKQLDGAEREKQFLSDKIPAGRTPAVAQRGGVNVPPKKRTVTTSPGVRGTVLAVNQAYNFVVLNLGGRQGLEANAEMLVLRAGTLIGKIRVSSVEPATAIGDIVGSSLAPGVQVQPGDTVIYAGTNS